jgi:hypothetical protein
LVTAQRQTAKLRLHVSNELGHIDGWDVILTIEEANGRFDKYRRRD